MWTVRWRWRRHQIFQKHMWDDFDEEAMELVNKGINPIGFPGLRTSVTSEDSKQINFDPRSEGDPFCQRYV